MNKRLARTLSWSFAPALVALAAVPAFSLEPQDTPAKPALPTALPAHGPVQASAHAAKGGKTGKHGKHHKAHRHHHAK